MTVPLILASWLSILAVVVGLCLAARRGDIQDEQALRQREHGEQPVVRAAAEFEVGVYAEVGVAHPI